MMAEAVNVQERLLGVQTQVAAACMAAGRSPADVRLVAVSKTHGAQAVAQAYLAGQRDFGENRPEEAVEKISAVQRLLPDSQIHWHMIGHIQSRKAQLVTSRFALIHSLDTVKLAGKVSRMAVEAGCVVNALLEVNVSGEVSKSGWQAAGWVRQASVRESLWDDIRSILTGMPGLHICGLMTMAPVVEEAEQARPVFAALRGLRDALRTDFSQGDWSQLSMGMTDDFPVAIAEGATLVRIGRAIFGSRAR
jgi:pyridoxal phosphate enzyme (YggS family)